MEIQVVFTIEAANRREADEKLGELLNAASRSTDDARFSHCLVDGQSVDEEWDNDFTGENVWAGVNES